MLASLYNGNVHVWNHESQTLVKSFEVTDLPGESSAKLAASRRWYILIMPVVNLTKTKLFEHCML